MHTLALPQSLVQFVQCREPMDHTLRNTSLEPSQGQFETLVCDHLSLRPGTQQLVLSYIPRYNSS